MIKGNRPNEKLSCASITEETAVVAAAAATAVTRMIATSNTH